VSIEFHSLDALPELGAALARFYERAGGALEMADVAARRMLEWLDATIRHREFEVERLQRARRTGRR
jgi:hypothetical protein